MDLQTATVLLRRERAQAWPDQAIVEPALGLLGLAASEQGDARGRGAVRIALDAVRNHVRQNEDVLRRFRARPAPELRTEVLGVLQAAVQRAAGEVFAMARRGALSITLDVVLALEHEAFVAHVGDGRAYLVRRGLVHQLTTDHVGEDSGVLVDPERPAPRSVRALGPEPRVRTESLCMELAAGDRIVLIAGHVHAAVPETILHRALTDAHLDDLGERLGALDDSLSIVAVAAQLGGSSGTGKGAAAARLGLLAPMALFKHCTELELRAVASATVPRRYSAGQTLFQAGERGEELFLLVHGDVGIEKDGETIATLGPGTAFGEMALLDEPGRSATARATTDVEALVIPRAAFFRLLRANPPLAVKILWNMLLRLSGNLRRTSGEVSALRRMLDELGAERGEETPG